MKSIRPIFHDTQIVIRTGFVRFYVYIVGRYLSPRRSTAFSHAWENIVKAHRTVQAKMALQRRWCTRQSRRD